MPRKSRAQVYEEIHYSAIQQFNDLQSTQKDQRQLAAKDISFVNAEDGQWEEDAIEKRRDRPRYTINKIAGPIDQIVGEQRQTRMQIKVNPRGDGATKEVSNIYRGLILDIENQSRAESIYDCAFDECVTSGYAGWRIITKFCSENSFDQEILLKPIMGACTSLWFDPSAQEYDKRDAKYAYLITDMSRKEYEKRFPKSSPITFDTDVYNKNNCSEWISDNKIRVAEYWVKTLKKTQIALLSNGKIIKVDEEKELLEALLASGVEVVNQRVAETQVVERYMLNGAEVIEGPKVWAGKYIPLVPLYGRRAFSENKEYVRGIVRFAKDAQRIYNYATSSAIEATALTPKDPIWYTPEQAKGHETLYKTFNLRNDPFMPYNPDPRAPGAPQRTGAPSVQTALIQQIQQATLDIHATTGLEPASLGNVPELKSGKAIEAQQRMGDRGSFIFSDNLRKSIVYTGEILIDLIPKIYDTQRKVRVLNESGESEEVTINQAQDDKFLLNPDQLNSEDVELMNDMSVGRYQVSVEAGPAYKTLKEENVQKLIQLSAASPAFQEAALDLIAKNLNIAESEEITSRIRRQMIAKGLVQPTDEEVAQFGLNQEPAPDPAVIVALQNLEMQTLKLQSDIENKNADTAKKVAETQTETIEALKGLLESYNKQQDAGIPLNATDLENKNNQDRIIQEAQERISPNKGQALIDEVLEEID